MFWKFENIFFENLKTSFENLKTFFWNLKTTFENLKTFFWKFEKIFWKFENIFCKIWKHPLKTSFENSEPSFENLKTFFENLKTFSETLFVEKLQNNGKIMFLKFFKVGLTTTTYQRNFLENPKKMISKKCAENVFLSNLPYRVF